MNREHRHCARTFDIKASQVVMRKLLRILVTDVGDDVPAGQMEVGNAE